MPLTLQAKLLRILQDNCVRPLGTNQERRIDIRIMAATNRHLEEEVRQGRFRKDLFYRLETFAIEVSPLRSGIGGMIWISSPPISWKFSVPN